MNSRDRAQRARRTPPVLPDTAERFRGAVGEHIRNRNYIVAVVDIPGAGASACCSQGSHFGGHALYVKDGRLHYVYDFVGMLVGFVVGTEDVPTGKGASCPRRSRRTVRPPGACPCSTATRWGRTVRGAAAFGLSGTDLLVGRATT